MGPTELAAIGTAIGAAAGALIGYGWRRGKHQAALGSVLASHGRLKDEFIKHKDDREIHIDPKRDGQAMIELKTFMAKRFDRIDERCEKRGEACAGHFANVGTKIAAITGKSNGTEE